MLGVTAVTNRMRVRVTRIAAAAVFVGGASLAVAGMAAAEEPDPCAVNPSDPKCAPADSPSPSTSAGNGITLGPITLPLPGGNDSSTPASSAPASSGSTTPPASGTPTSAPPTSGPPASSPPPSTSGSPTPSTPASPSESGKVCDIANGGVDCGTTQPGNGNGNGNGPQRNYGAPTTAAPVANNGSGTTGAGDQELAKTGADANMTWMIIGGVGMAAGGFAFTVLPGRLNRRDSAAAA